MNNIVQYTKTTLDNAIDDVFKRHSGLVSPRDFLNLPDLVNRAALILFKNEDSCPLIRQALIDLDDSGSFQFTDEEKPPVEHVFEGVVEHKPSA